MSYLYLSFFKAVCATVQPSLFESASYGILRACSLRRCAKLCSGRFTFHVHQAPAPNNNYIGA